ncbi:TIGR03862 family flavoprotein [Polaromonas sp.]|uniref:TIGR03862 family flavoprotein n=1 Tax=Polaromonas sp. TaxID=1869339 RepID=UPI002CCF11D8|nr:TIGR03862 family flavoprotein [Polaromonas sp.]HQS33454.1 TIGR03862 family flavoprotein [Polaromonas sp.]HQS89783.1 TIGR03862 family flavoprotein [Polaromonas sp.]
MNDPQTTPHVPRIVIIGGGPAGLMAAEVLASAGPAAAHIAVYDAMPSVGRKFLLAGKGGLNLTHAEPAEPFLSRYGSRSADLQPMLSAFGPTELRAWAETLGVETFVGSSGRVFPKDMKAAPLLRAWLHRLRGAGVQFFMRHRWLGWSDEGALVFSTPDGDVPVQADAVVLALGGGSWARLGSDGAWVPLLEKRGVMVARLQPSNCGFDVGAAVPDPADALETRREFFRDLVGKGPSTQPGWTEHFASRFAGQPFKSVAIHFTDSQGRSFSRKGEFVATATGVEGSLVYAASSLLRDEIAAHGSATFMLDLLPDRSHEQVLVEVRHPRGSRSLSSHLKSRLSLDGIKAAMLYEVLGKDAIADPVRLAAGIKALPVRVVAARPIDEAISSAGGVLFEAMTPQLQLKAPELARPPVFCAGEMLDWEAPTGGHLLTACFASGTAAGHGVLSVLGLQPR